MSSLVETASEGQKTAQREIATALETALDARRQRIMISQSQVSLLKWSCLLIPALCALVAIAMVHSDNRLASIIAMGIFGTGVAASILLILAHRSTLHRRDFNQTRPAPGGDAALEISG